MICPASLGHLRYDTRCYCNVRSKAGISQFIYRTEVKTKKWNKEIIKSKIRQLRSRSAESVESVLKLSMVVYGHADQWVQLPARGFLLVFCSTQSHKVHCF